MGGVQQGVASMRATLMVHDKWVPIEKMDAKAATAYGGSGASAYFEKRSQDPERAKRLATVRSNLGAALEATYGKRTGLVALRLKAGLSQAELATRLETQQPSIARWERNPQAMSAQNMIALAKALGVSSSEVIAAIENQQEIKSTVPEHATA